MGSSEGAQASVQALPLIAAASVTSQSNPVRKATVSDASKSHDKARSSRSRNASSVGSMRGCGGSSSKRKAKTPTGSITLR